MVQISEAEPFAKPCQVAISSEALEVLKGRCTCEWVNGKTFLVTGLNVRDQVIEVLEML